MSFLCFIDLAAKLTTWRDRGAYLVPFAKPIEPRRGNDAAKAKELWDLSEALIREALAE